MLPNSIFVIGFSHSVALKILHLHIGADTALRLINPDYYEGSMDKMVSGRVSLARILITFNISPDGNKTTRLQVY